MVVAFKTARKYFFSRRTPAKVSGNLKFVGIFILTRLFSFVEGEELPVVFLCRPCLFSNQRYLYFIKRKQNIFIYGNNVQM